MKSILVTGGAGFIGSNLCLELQERFADAWITVVDDFRSGDFKNLQGFRGDIVAADLSRLNWQDQFGRPEFDAVFHLASITATTEHNQFLQVHDNVESFRRLLRFIEPSQAPIVYASSAATYGIASRVNREDDPPAPANVYAFSKVHLDNLARHTAQNYPDWKIVGLRYFNVYGPREAHKGLAASMILHLARQMHAGQRPRIFRAGQHKRDFVYVKDIVTYTIAALDAPHSTILNAGSGQPRSFNELVAILNQALGTSFDPEYIENPYPFYQPHTEADMSQTQALLKCKPQFSLEKGVEDYLASGYLVPR